MEGSRERWRTLAAMPARRYDVPSGRVGRRFVQALAAELTGIWQRRWNAERFIVFQTVTLQHARHVPKSCEIRQRIDRRLDTWEAGEHHMLVEDTARTCEKYLSTSRGEDPPEHRANIYHSLVLGEKL